MARRIERELDELMNRIEQGEIERIFATKGGERTTDERWKTLTLTSLDDNFNYKDYIIPADINRDRDILGELLDTMEEYDIDYDTYDSGSVDVFAIFGGFSMTYR